MNRKGFTLIELLIVVVIIGILAAIAIPKFANTKEKAYIASMKSDLRNLVTAEEAYFADSVKYSSTISCANPAVAGTVQWCATTGNTLGTVTVGTGTQAGWTAGEWSLEHHGEAAPSTSARSRRRLRPRQARPEGAPRLVSNLDGFLI